MGLLLHEGREKKMQNLADIVLQLALRKYESSQTHELLVRICISHFKH